MLQNCQQMLSSDDFGKIKTTTNHQYAYASLQGYPHNKGYQFSLLPANPPSWATRWVQLLW